MIDSERKTSITTLSLYLTDKEAEEIIKGLQNLLKDANAYEHWHVFDKGNPEKEISFSLITGEKLKNLDRYNDLERKIFSER